MKKLLVACEYSGTVRDAFKNKGWDAWSCDLLPTDVPGQHYQCDIREVLNKKWDSIIGHPPCTFLSNSGAKHLYIDGKKENGLNKARWDKMKESCDFFKLLLDHPCPKIAIENPIMHGHAKKIIGQNQTQIIHPHYFGDSEVESKSTCLWLKGLEPLKRNRFIDKSEIKQSLHKLGPSKDRWKIRSTTFKSIAEAMAEQWTD